MSSSAKPPGETTEQEEAARSSRRRQKLEAHLTSGCGFGKTKKRLLEIFDSAIWPGLKNIGWDKVEGTGRQAGALFFLPPGVTVTEGKKGVDYYDRIRDVIDRVCASEASFGEAAIAEGFLKQMEQMNEFEVLPEELVNKSKRKRGQSDYTDDTNEGEELTASSRAAVPLDLSWKDGGTCYPKQSSRVGKAYQATKLPRAGTFSSDDIKLDPDLQVDLIWDNEEAEKRGVIDFVHTKISVNKREAAMAEMHKQEYSAEKVRDAIRDQKVLDGSDWSAEEKDKFVKEMFRLRKNLVAVAKSTGMSVNNVFTYYLGSFKKSDNYRLLKTIREEERAERLAASEQGLDACGICGEGGSLLICDGCEGEFHMHCLRPQLANIPEGHWECDDCVNRKFLEVRDRMIKKFYVRVCEGSNKRKAEVIDSGDDSDGGARRSNRKKSGNVILRPSEPVLKAVRELADSLMKAFARG